MEYEKLQKLAKDHGYTVDTFSTHAPNFYENAVLFIAVGQKHCGFTNRHSHRVLKTWDVSYSIGRNPDGNNKWARAINYAYQYIQENPIAPNPNELDRIEMERRRNHKKQYNREYRAEQNRQQNNINQMLQNIKPVTLREVSNKLSRQILNSFGIDENEHNELLDDPNLIGIYNDHILVKQSTLSHGTGWYKINGSPYDRPFIPLN